MNLQKTLIRWHALVVLFGLSCMQMPLFGMEIAEISIEEGLEKGLLEGTEEAGFKVAEGGVETIMEEMGVDVSKLKVEDPELYTNMEEEIKGKLQGAVEGFNGQIAAGSPPEINIKFSTGAQEALEVPKLKEISPETAKALSGAVPEGELFIAEPSPNAAEYAPLDNAATDVQNKAGDFLDAAEGGDPVAIENADKALGEAKSNVEVEGQKLETAANENVVAKDDALNSAEQAADTGAKSGDKATQDSGKANEAKAKKDAGDAKKGKDEKATKSYSEQMKTQKTDYNTKKEAYNNAKAENKELKDIQKDPKKYSDAKEKEITQLNKDIDDLQTLVDNKGVVYGEDGETILNEYSEEEMVGKKEELTKKKQDLEKTTTNKKIADDAIADPKTITDKITASDEKVKTTKEARNAAKKDYQTTAQKAVEGQSLATSIKQLDGKILAYKGRAFFKGLAVEAIGSAVGGLFMALGAAAYSAAETEWNKYQLNKTLSKAQNFGGVYMCIPSDLLDASISANEGFVYVGLPVSDTNKADDFVIQANTIGYLLNQNTSSDAKSITFESCATSLASSQLNPANFYVSYDDSGKWGSTYIGGSSFPNTMVHLNTGFRFAGNGEPSDLENPILPYFPSTDPVSSIVAECINLSGIVANNDPVVSCLFNADANDSNNVYQGNQYSYPAVLKASISVIHDGGINFGPLNLTEMQPLTDSNITLLSSPDVALIDRASYSKVSTLPYASLGVEVYQTKGTDLVTSGYFKGTGLSDFVVALDAAENVTSVYSVDTSNKYGFAQLGLNPDVAKVVSLLDGTEYDNTGAKLGVIATIPNPNIPSNYISLNNQISLLKTYLENKAKYGSFTYGTTTLTTEKEWVDSEIPVYKVVGGLSIKDESGNVVTVDDYVIPVGKDSNGAWVTFMLPQPTVLKSFYFISLVTSRFYDPQMNVVPSLASYWLYKDESNNLGVSTSLPGSGKTSLCGSDPCGSAAIGTLFMDGDINPVSLSSATIATISNNLKDTDLTLSTNWLPVPNQWSLTIFAPGNEGGSMSVALSARGQADLLNAIDQAHDTWKSAYIGTMDTNRALINEVGPFKWAMLATVPMNIKATSLEDIVQGIFVYQSSVYPDEYLIIAPSTNVPTDLQQFDLAAPQQYLISLSSGMIYDGKNSGQPAVDASGIAIKIDPAAALKALTQIAKNQTLYTKIDQSQASYKQMLIDSVQYYGQRAMFLFPEDKARGQYVYADVTGISDYADQYAQGTLLGNVVDFFVFSNDGTTYGMPLNNNSVGGTKSGASVVSGSVFDRNNSLGHFVSQTSVQSKTINELPSYFASMQYQQLLIDMVNAQAAIITGNPVNDLRKDLKNRIGALSAPLSSLYQAEQDAFKAAEEQRAAQNPPLDAGAANLDSASVPYLSPDVLGSRDIKYFAGTGKYYFVSSYVPTNGIKYMDFNAGPAGKDNQLIMLYDTNGNPVSSINNPYLVIATRLNNGIYVASNGAQTLGMPIINASIPVTQMVKLDSTTLKTAQDAAQVAYTNAFNAFVKGGTGTSEALAQAAQAFGSAKVAYQSALTIEAKASEIAASAPAGATFEFYINQEITHYYVLVTTATEKYYIDILLGFEYNLDGTPRLTKNVVFKNVYNPQDELFYKFSTVDVSLSGLTASTGQDALNTNNSLLTLVYTGGSDGITKTYVQNGEVAKVRNQALITDFYPGVTFSTQGSEQVLLYNMNTLLYSTTLDDEGEEEIVSYNDLKVYQNDPTYAASNNQINKFAIKEVITDVTGNITDLAFTGSYTPETGVYSMMPVYYQTRTGSDIVMTDSATFILQPLVIVWDGGSDLKLQRMMYKGKLLTLTGSGSTYSAGSVQVTIQQDASGYGRWLTVTDGAAQYDFLLDSEIAAIADYKQVWGLNLVTDVESKTQLVSSLSTALKSVTIASDFIDAVKFTDNSSAQFSQASNVTNDLAKVSFDSVNQRYVYKLSSTSDAGQPYFMDTWNGWHVDLRSGILFDLYNYPQLALNLEQLWYLLDTIEMNVVYDNNQALKLAYRSPCNVVMNAIAQGLTVEESAKAQCNLLTK
jgi:hypothetical protein